MQGSLFFYYAGRKLIYVHDDNENIDYVTEKHFDYYLLIRTNSPKMTITFSTQKALIARLEQEEEAD